jgi:hypothetical protein
MTGWPGVFRPALQWKLSRVLGRSHDKATRLENQNHKNPAALLEEAELTAVR